MNAIKNITIGHTERLYKPVGYTMLANLVNIVPFCLSIEAIRIIFNAFDGSGQPLDTPRLWWIFGIMVVYMLVMALAERASYRANFRGAYEMSASGRLSLAEHLRKLSLGFLSKRDPGDLSSMLITDFMMAETGISHHLPQLMGAVVMPVLAFASLVWIDWRMAVSMFAALPLALLVLWASTKAQRKLSGRQIQAKINAGNRLEEYLQGIRVMKAYNLLGDRFVRLRDAFAQLRRACIRQEALLGPFVLLSITLVRAGLTMMVLCGTYLLLGGKLSLLVFVLFLVVGSRVFDPLTSALTNFAEFRYFSIAGGRILSLMNETEMKGETLKMKIYKSITELIGKTPLFEVSNIEQDKKLMMTTGEIRRTFLDYFRKNDHVVPINVLIVQELPIVRGRNQLGMLGIDTKCQKEMLGKLRMDGTFQFIQTIASVFCYQAV